MINANENPLGPCPEARERQTNIITQGGRIYTAKPIGWRQFSPNRNN